MTAIDTVLFDLDGTLVEHGHALLPPLFAEWGYERSDDDVKEATAKGVHHFYNHIAAAEEQGWVPELYRQFYHLVLVNLSIPDEDESRAEAVQTFFETNPVPPLFPDVRGIVEILDRRGFKMAVITQRGREGADRFLDEHGVTSYFPVIVAGDEGHGRKPTAQPFLRALELLNSTPARAVYIGDRIDDDCEGATGAGLGAFLIDRDGVFSLEASARDDFVHLTDLAQLTDFLPEVNP